MNTPGIDAITVGVLVAMALLLAEIFGLDLEERVLIAVMSALGAGVSLVIRWFRKRAAGASQRKW
jgi:hypothetical protein